MPARRRTASVKKFGELLLTRDRARLVAKELPIADILVLAFDGVEVASPSFLDQIIRSMVERGVVEIQFEGFNRQIGRNIDRVLKARESAGEEKDVLAG